EIDEARVFGGGPVAAGLEAPVAAGHLVAADKDVQSRVTDAGNAGRRVQIANQFRIARGVGRVGNVHFFEELLGKETILAAFERVAPPRIIPGRRTERALAVDEDIVLCTNIVSAMGEDRAERSFAWLTAAYKNISENRVAAIAIIEINGRVA